MPPFPIILRDITTGIVSIAVAGKRQRSETSVCSRFLVVTLRDPADQRGVGVDRPRRATSSSSASEGIRTGL